MVVLQGPAVHVVEKLLNIYAFKNLKVYGFCILANFRDDAKMITKYLPFFCFLLILTSCVSSKKYNLLESENATQSRRISGLEIEKEKGLIAAKELEETKSNLSKTERLLLEVNSKNNGLQESYDFLEKAYEEVLLQNAELLEVTSKEKTTLTNEINKKQEELDLQESLLADREARIQIGEAKINELEALLQNEKLKMDTLQSSISNALFVFGPSDLSIEQKGGKIYVSLSQKLLFNKGSDKIDSKGQNAIKKLADVLQRRSDINIMVEGHTDPDGTIDRNWSLSTRRATAVVKLLQSSGVNPIHLTAAGKSFYDPVAENDTEENKSKNRRTEIILSPKLDQIMELIRSN